MAQTNWRWNRRFDGGITRQWLVYQAVGAANDASRFLARGQRVDVGSFQMRLHCVGTGSPTVILEAMAGNNSTEWGWIQPEVAKFTRVCAYDRAG